MFITMIELKHSFGKYLVLSATEDVFITKNGKIVSKLTPPCIDRIQTAKSLFGILPQDSDIKGKKLKAWQRINESSG